MLFSLLDLIECRHCHSTNIKPFKTLGHGPKQGNVFHYGIECLNCRKRYHIPRNAETFQFVKDIPWKKSKGFKKATAGSMSGVARQISLTAKTEAL